MKGIGRNIDFWQRFSLVQRGLKNRFGIRVEEGRCWGLFQLGDDEASTFGTPQNIPVNLSTLPTYLRVFVDELCLSVAIRIYSIFSPVRKLLTKWPRAALDHDERE